MLELSLDALISEVDLVFYLAQHQSLFVHQLHVVVSRVGVPWYWVSDLAEVAHRFSSLSIVNYMPVDHQHDVVELHEDLGRGLMDR